MLQALAAHHGVDGFSVVHFDTHADTGSEEGEAPHGVPFHRAVVDGHLDGRNIVQIGLRGAWPFPEDFQWMREAGFRWHTAAEIVERGIGPVVHDAIEHAAVAGAADLPDGGHRRARSGIRARHRHRRARAACMTRELLWAVRTVASRLDLCAMDIVEVSPPFDPAGITAMAGQRVVLETLSGIALRKTGREPRPERP